VQRLQQALQFLASYTVIRKVLRWLASTLLAYGAAAILARPDPEKVLRGTIIPTVHGSREFLSLTVAVIGTTLSAYLYTWQSNQEVEEKVAKGKVRESERRGTSSSELQRTRWDTLVGMFFSSLVLYSILLSTGATLHEAGTFDVETAAQAARALRPLAGGAAEALFAAGIVGVGFLAVPIMTTGAAYDLCQAVGWKHGLGLKPREAKAFYGATAVFTALGVLMNFLGLNPMKALVWAGIVQGFSTPPLLFIILLATNDRKLMGRRVNGAGARLLGALTVVVVLVATVGLVGDVAHPLTGGTFEHSASSTAGASAAHDSCWFMCDHVLDARANAARGGRAGRHEHRGNGATACLGR